MGAERKKIIALIAFLMVVLVGIVWQTTGALRDHDQVRRYEVTPPSAFASEEDPTIVDPAKLDGPLIPDEAHAQLLAAGRADYAIVADLRVSDRAGLIKRMGSAAKADQVIDQLAPDAANLAGASPEPLTTEVADYSERGALVRVFAVYRLANVAPAYRTFTFSYSPTADGFRLDGVAESAGAQQAPDAGSAG